MPTRRAAAAQDAPTRWPWAPTAPLVLLLLAGACAPASAPAVGGDEPAGLAVLATTGIVGDIVGRVGGERIAVTVLVPPESDAHAFVPTPRDLVAVARADAIFGSGLGLEAFLGDMVASAGGAEPILLAEATRKGAEPSDPHVWMDVREVIRWTGAVAEALASRDPEGGPAFAANAAAYAGELEALDAWIAGRLAEVPEERRAIVTDHQALGAFCARYGCRVAGAIVPSSSTEGSASPRQLALLEGTIAREGIRAIVVDRVAESPAARRLAAATGAEVVALSIESLGPAGSGADTYLGLMRDNVERLVAALR